MIGKPVAGFYFAQDGEIPGIQKDDDKGGRCGLYGKVLA